MGKTHEVLTAKHAKFMAKMPVFFVATAPSSTEQRVNVSPRAPGTSCVVTGPSSVAFADLTGSGCETAAHVLENGRMTLLFVNLLEGPPQMLRLHGKAKIMLPEETDEELVRRFPAELTASSGFRCVFLLDIDRISSSCGYSMPVMTLERYRNTLYEKTEETDAGEYRALKNCYSIDGLPSLELLKHADFGPKPTEGYVFAQKLPWFDVVGKFKARSRLNKVRTSRARGGTTSVWPTTTTTIHRYMVLVAGLVFVAVYRFLDEEGPY